MARVNLSFFKVLELPVDPQPDAIYYVLDEENNIANWYVTTSEGVAIPASDAAAVQALIDAYSAQQPKIYRALLTQTGTAAPVATVLENSLGGTVVWTYTGVGIYRGTLTGAFPTGKTYLAINSSQTVDGFGGGLTATIARVNENIVEITTVLIAGAAFDEQLTETSIEILVYP